MTRCNSVIWLVLCLNCGTGGKMPEVVAEPELQVTGDGGAYICALSDTGGVNCWGSVPCHGPRAGQTFIDITAMWSQACGVTLDHEIRCWSLSGEERFDASVAPEVDWEIEEISAFELGLVESFDYFGSDYGNDLSNYTAGCARGTDGGVTCQTMVHGEPSRHRWAPYPDQEILQIELLSWANVALSAEGGLWKAACEHSSGVGGTPCTMETEELMGEMGLEEVHLSRIGAYCGRDGEGGVSCVDEQERFALVSFPELWSHFTVDHQAEEPNHTICGIRPDGSLSCTDGGEPFLVPEAEEAFGGWPEGRFVAIDSYNRLPCALREDGELKCWGAEAEEIGELRPCTR